MDGKIFFYSVFAVAWTAGVFGVGIFLAGHFPEDEGLLSFTSAAIGIAGMSFGALVTLRGPRG